MGTLRFTWWNLQNFFDTDDDPISKDFEFTAEHGWTEEVFEAKKQNLAHALAITHDAPLDLVAVAEIEKDTLLEELLEAAGQDHLEVVRDPEGTSDLRGIDVAVAFDPEKLTVLETSTHVVHLRYRTRDIFEIVFDVRETGEAFTLIASHWPSRSLGRFRSEPLRIAVAEHIAYLVESHVKFDALEYEALREQDDLAAVQARWEAKVMVVGDFNDEPGDRSVVDHLRAGGDLDRVVGETNDIDSFREHTADYRKQDVFLYNATRRFMAEDGVGSYFLAGLRSGETFAHRYQTLDQLVASRGLLTGQGLTLDLDTVAICRHEAVATGSGRPRGFKKSSRKGTSDHLPVTAVLRY